MLCKQQVGFVATGAPSKRLHEVRKETLPNLRSLALDPVHVAMHYEARRQHTKRRGLLYLRRGLAKFNNHADGQGGDWGAFFTGHAEVRFTSHETTLRRQISDGRMTKGIAQRLLNSMETISTWCRRAGFIEFLAAFSAVYRSEVTNETEDGKRLVDLLHHATDGDQVEWLVNNLRLRSLFSKGDDAPSWNNQQ